MLQEIIKGLNYMTSDSEISVGKHALKINYAVLASAVLFIVLSAYFFGVSVTELESNIAENAHDLEIQQHQLDLMEVSQDQLVADSIALQVKLATIEVKLNNIEMLLLEMRQND